ncbi:hypothetical protein F4775DRAFT_572100 [Biscogniauxia sp. FL1348]|nr:hypothetical protein F4775DRAFT_572100 [Biscogniauxia sp. FL1348]
MSYLRPLIPLHDSEHYICLSPGKQASRTMSSLSIESLLTLLGVLFCLPQLILSALTWYEGRCARLYTKQNLNQERCIELSSHGLPAHRTSADERVANTASISRESAYGRETIRLNTGLPMDIPTRDHRDSGAATGQPPTRTSSHAHQRPLSPSPPQDPRSQSWPVQPKEPFKP